LKHFQEAYDYPHAIHIGYESRQVIIQATVSNPHDTGPHIFANIDLVAGNFRGVLSGSISRDSLVTFNSQLEKLYRTLRGKAFCQILDYTLEVVVEGNGFGHVTASVKAFDYLGQHSMTHFDFGIDLDQTFLPELINEIKTVLEASRSDGKTTPETL
jgi:hypothetical protein